MFLREDFTAKGEVRLPGASIGGGLFMKATFDSSKTAVSLESATIGSLLHLQETHINGLMDLDQCRVRQLDDDRESWPAAGDFPPWGTVWWYFRRWRREGVWTEIHPALYPLARAKTGRQPGPSVVIMDAQSVKPRRLAAPDRQAERTGAKKRTRCQTTSLFPPSKRPRRK